jgi:pyridoxal phosphate enzyme (YggS family)
MGPAQIEGKLKYRLEKIRKRMKQAAIASGRSEADIQLVAVSKTRSKEQVLEAFETGVSVFGENYVQEAREKFKALYTHPISWHFIGHLQSNKAKYVVTMFDLIHSVDSLRLAKELDKHAGNNRRIQKVLVQVNIAEEDSKSGVSARNTLPLIEEMSRLKNVAVKGLMTMPPYFNAPEKVRPFFKALRKLRDDIDRLHIPGVSMQELSMGMSGDFEVAIQEGATLVRIGTAIFGARQ